MKTPLNGSGRSVPAWMYLLAGLALIVGTVPHTFAMEIKGPGLWLSTEKSFLLSEPHKTQLLENLRQITGFNELQFGENGQLQLGPTVEYNDRSAAARQVLQRAIESGFVFLIEDHTGSPEVTFGQLDEGTHYEDEHAKRRLLIWRLRLDFDDFRNMEAPRRVRESFSVGFAFLHELLHGLGHRDALTIEEIGECEEVINKVRLELSLPTRDQYFASQLRITGNYFTYRLKFRDHLRRKDEYLFFMTPPGSAVAEVTESMVTVRKQSR